VASAADTEAILVEDLVVDMEVVAMEDHMVLTSKAVKSTLEMYSLLIYHYTYNSSHTLSAGRILKTFSVAPVM